MTHLNPRTWDSLAHVIDERRVFDRAQQQGIYRLLQALAAGEMDRAASYLTQGVVLDTLLVMAGPEAVPEAERFTPAASVWHNDGALDHYVPTPLPAFTRISPLAWAVSEEREGLVHWCLEHEADPSLVIEHGRDAGWLAVEKGDDTLLELFLNHGASATISTTNRLGRLHHAVWLRQAECVQVLLDHGSDVSMSDARGYTPLHLVLGRNPFTALDARIARLLLEKGANPFEEARDGRAPQDFVDDDVKRSVMEAYGLSLALDRIVPTPTAPAAEPEDGSLAPVPDLLPGVPQIKNPPRKRI